MAAKETLKWFTFSFFFLRMLFGMPCLMIHRWIEHPFQNCLLRAALTD